MRWLAIVVLVIGCKKQEEPAPDPMPTTPPSGHSITKVKEPGEEGSDAPSGKSLQSAAQAKEQGSATPPSGAPTDAQMVGGNGKPAYRDDNGHLHGPGGPIFMGKGPECTNKLDHCLRDGVWFAVGDIRPGSLFRAVPVYQFEGKWWTFHGDENTDFQFLLRTKVVEKSSELAPGQPILWFISENSAKKWVDNEMDALTSSRWEVGVIDAVNTDNFRVKGFDAPVPIDTARVIVEKKSS